MYFIATLRYGGRKQENPPPEIKAKLLKSVDKLLGQIGVAEADYWDNDFERAQAKTLVLEQTRKSNEDEFEESAALLLQHVHDLESTL